MEHMVGKQKFHTLCYRNECYCNLVYYHQRNINERPVLDTEVSILESEIRQIFLDANTSWKNCAAVNMMTSRPLLLKVQLFFAFGRDSRFPM